MTKVLVVLGTRPEAIKLAPVIRALQTSRALEVNVCSTAQHREMLQQVLEFFQLHADFDLNVMKPNQSLPELTASIINQLTPVLKNYKPDWVLVQGDTTTAMAGALCAFYEKIKVGHVEAGLRSYNSMSPFPEEMNRLIVSRIATCHFCPTDAAVENLLKEGITASVFQVGNTVVDAAIKGSEIINQIDQTKYLQHFQTVDFSKKIILVTCHRRESFGEPFLGICQALMQLVKANPDYEVVYPVHLNPNIKTVAHEQLHHPRIKLLDPLSYPQLLWLLNICTIVLTDSGGIQEEAPSFKKPVLVLREVTERMEGVKAGTARLVGTQTKKIVDEAMRLLEDKAYYQSMTATVNPYGDGKTSERIVEIIERFK